MRKITLLSLMMITGFVLTSFTGKQTAILNNASPATVEIMDIDQDVYNDCTGEDVHLSGQALVVIISNVNKNRVSGNYHMNLQGVTGVGLNSGTVYHFSYVLNAPFSSPVTGGASTFTVLTRWNMVGGGARFSMKGNLHSTINAGGTATSYIDNLTISCQ